MKFCKECENYLILQAKNTDSKGRQILSYYCNNCGYEEKYDENKTKDNCIFESNYDTTILNKNEINTEYLVYDPTLPRINNITCINNECITNKVNIDESKKVSNEVVYFIIDDKNMTYEYLCCHCKTKWTNKES